MQSPLLDGEGERLTRDRISETAAFIWPYFKPFLPYFFLGLTLMILTTGCDLAVPLLLKEIFDYSLPHKDLNSAQKGLALLSLAFLFRLGFSYYQGILLGKKGFEMVNLMKETLLRHILSLDLAFFSKNPSGRLLSRLETDCEFFKELFSIASLSILKSLFTLLGVVVLLFYQSTTLGWTVLLTLIVLFPPVYLAFNALRKFYGEARKKQGEMTGFISDILHNMDLVLLYRYQDHTVNKLEGINRNYTQWMGLWDLLNHFFFSSLLFLEILALSALIFVSVELVTSGKMTLGSLILVIECTRLVFQPLVQLSEQIHLLQKSVISAARIMSLFSIKSEISPPQNPQPCRFSQNLVFQQVKFSYGGEEWALDDISLTLKKGEILALVGPSGGGKTSLTNLLFRFFDPQQGNILIDGVDLKNFHSSEWRSKIGFILQDLQAFPGTAFENLALFHSHRTPETIYQKACDYGLEKILFPGGDLEILNRPAHSLSRGENQLFSFLRSLLHDPELLVLDEATAALDMETESKVTEILLKLKGHITLIIIAHRLKTVEIADQILFLKKGKIMEKGSHQNLMKLGGFYREYYLLGQAGLEV